jgi:hypothetical protein
VKFSVRQILASAAGAVLAALIASSFGVKGTIIGVAIGSVAATLGTALVSQSIERGHEAVKQVAVRAPDSTLLRRLGGTGVSGQPQATVGSASAPTEAVPATSGSGNADDRTATMAATATGDTQRFEVSAEADAPATERLRAVTLPVEPVDPDGRAGPTGRRFSWRAIAGTAGVVFLVALLFVTAVELVSGKPLSSIFGDHGSGPSIKEIFVPSTPAPAPGTTTTTTTSVPATTTTTTGAAGTSSTTTVSTTTTTSPSSKGSTTSTTGPSGTTTTTTAPGGTTTSSAAG